VVNDFLTDKLLSVETAWITGPLGIPGLSDVQFLFSFKTSSSAITERPCCRVGYF